MAAHVAEGAASVPGIEVRVRSVEEATREDVIWCDGMAVGTPTNLGLTSWKMKRFWDGFRRKSGPGGWQDRLCVFLIRRLGRWRRADMRSHPDHAYELRLAHLRRTDYVGKKFTLHYGAVTAREPRSEEEIAACHRLGKRLAQWVAVYTGWASRIASGADSGTGMTDERGEERVRRNE